MTLIYKLINPEPYLLYLALTHTTNSWSPRSAGVGFLLPHAWPARNPLQSSGVSALGRQSANLLRRPDPPRDSPSGSAGRSACASRGPGTGTAVRPLGHRGLLYPSVLAAGNRGARGGQSSRGHGSSPDPAWEPSPPETKGQKRTHSATPRDKLADDRRQARGPRGRRAAGTEVWLPRSGFLGLAGETQGEPARSILRTSGTLGRRIGFFRHPAGRWPSSIWFSQPLGFSPGEPSRLPSPPLGA
ncbi:uncharacterized protein LOC134739507 [Pongo pygmaeus]|uniref:uncharacterized protein LOC134739507 n=1 Tax=Pongo pygmaeus TaxID=9600 RepID=UPI00300D66B2